MELTPNKIEVMQHMLVQLLNSDEHGFVNEAARLTDIDVNQVLESVVKFRKALNRSRPESNHPGYQFEEGRVVDALLTDPPGVCSYVDIGASYPRECSNTWRLYEQGWRGLLIEPLPHCWPAILQQRPGDHLYPTAVSDEDGFAEFRIAGELSSLRDNWPIVDQATLTVETKKLSTILEDFSTIRDKCKLCSIDVEGHESSVMAGIDFSTFSPDMFIIEFRRHHPRRLGQSIASQWLEVLTANGYHPIDCSQINLILLHDRKMPLWATVKESVQITPDDYLKEYIA